MTKMSAIFSVCFALSFAILYAIAGRIWGTPHASPVRIIHSQSDQSSGTRVKLGERQLTLYDYHTIERGSYFRSRGNSKIRCGTGAGLGEDDFPQIEFAIYFDRVTPCGEDRLRLTEPRCVYYYERTLGQMDFPEKFEISAREGFLQQGEKDFSTLTLAGDVLLYGFDREQKIATTLRTKSLVVNFLQRTMETEENVEMEHRDVFSLSGVGMRGDYRLDELTLFRSGSLTIFSGIWQIDPSQKQGLYFDRLHSRCDGPTSIVYDRAQSLARVEQEENVEVTGEEAHLTCEKACFYLQKRLPAGTWDISRFEAQRNVEFQDGPEASRNRASGDFFQYSKGDSDSRIVMRENPGITLRDFGGFTLLEPSRRGKQREKQERMEVDSVRISCKDTLEWRREPGYRDYFKFRTGVHIEELSRDSQTRTLSADNAWLVVENRKTPQGTPVRNSAKARRSNIPLYLKATGKVRVEHERVNAAGEKLVWRRESDFESKTVLSGSPEIELKEIASGSEAAFFSSSALAVSKPETEAPAGKMEDLVIRSQQPMVFYMLEPACGNTCYACATTAGAAREKSGSALYYRTQKKVCIDRYLSGTDDKSGDLHCDKLSLVAHKSQNAGEKSAGTAVESMVAEGNVRFSSPEMKGKGDRLAFSEKGAKCVDLAGNARLSDKQGKISADRFYYDARAEVFEATGNVRLKNREAADGAKVRTAGGRLLRYYKKDGQLQLIGDPALISEEDQYLSAKEIRHWRESGEIIAREDVTLVFAADDENREQLVGIKPKASVSGKGKTGKYRLQTKYLRAGFDEAHKSVSFFRARHGVSIEKIPDGSGDKVEKASGERLDYREEKGKLSGSPAEIFYEGNRVIGREFHLDGAAKKAVCNHPQRVILPRSGDDNQFSELVAGPKKASPGSDIEITCVGPIRLDYERKEIEFNHRVLVQTTQGYLSCEKLTVFLEDDGVSRMVAQRHVKLSSEGRTAAADQLVWDEKTGLASLTGYPHVEIRSEKYAMVSEVVWFHLKTRRFFTRGQGLLLENSGLR